MLTVCCMNKLNILISLKFIIDRSCNQSVLDASVIWLPPGDLHSLVTVDSFDTYIAFIWFNPLKIYVLIFILYINLFLGSLFTCKHCVILQLKSHHCFGSYLCYEIIDNQVVILGLDLYCNALRHINFQHNR